LFLKAPSSIVGMSQGIHLNQPDRRTDHEVELAVIIGRSAKDVAAADALEYVAGYTIALDVAIRGPEEPSMRHSPDSYSVLGPWLVTANELPDASALDIELDVNGAIRQKSSTSDLIIGVAELIELASRFYTLQPGDVICTGTPEGVGPVNVGDLLVARIQGIGEMRVNVSGAVGLR
jgi:2-keto-4-pentenoate hydratase/2-oxohepta-3-ene-1,7-dioic acid hydratase in catechol pathway